MRKRDLKVNPASLSKYHTIDVTATSSDARPTIIEKQQPITSVPVPPPPPLLTNGSAMADGSNGSNNDATQPIKAVAMRQETSSSQSRKQFTDELRMSLISDSPTQKPRQIASQSK